MSDAWRYADTAGMGIVGIPSIKAALAVCQDKGWSDAVRLLDQSEVMGTAWGAACTLEVLNYDTGLWATCQLNGKTIYSLAHLYRVIRAELLWDGPVRLAVAAE